MSAVAAAAAVAAFVVLATADIAPAHADDALTPYRQLLRGPEGTRLLTIARRAMEFHWGGESAIGATIESAESAGVATTVVRPGADDALDSLSDWPGPPVGLFITLVGPRGTRACVGNVTPPRGTLGASLAALAVDALAADRRRPPVRVDELDSLCIVIAFAGPAETIADPNLVDPAREGLLVGGADVAVAFLPGEARTVSWALREARRLGVARPRQSVTYQRFPAVVLQEPAPPRRPHAGVSDVDP